LGSLRRHSNSGISALEVLVAAALALLLALIVWPNWVRSNRAANEAAAIATIRDINQAEISFGATYPAIGFAESISQLGGLSQPCAPAPARACLLADVAQPPFLSGGYKFAADGHGPVPRTSFLSQAVPLRLGYTGQLSFCSGNRWFIRYAADGRSLTDPENCDAMPLVR
jgi:type IV pilus assembly protein PilA